MTGMNMFSYCGNNPVNRYDPNGQNWLDAALDLVQDMIEIVETVIEKVETFVNEISEIINEITSSDAYDKVVELGSVYEEASGQDVRLPENIESIEGGKTELYYENQWEAKAEKAVFDVSVLIVTSGAGSALKFVNTFGFAAGSTTIGDFLGPEILVGTYTDYYYKITTRGEIWQYWITCGPKGSAKNNATCYVTSKDVWNAALKRSR